MYIEYIEECFSEIPNLCVVEHKLVCTEQPTAAAVQHQPSGPSIRHLHSGTSSN